MAKYEMIPLSGGVDPKSFGLGCVDVCPNDICPDVDINCDSCGVDFVCECDTDEQCHCGPTDPSCSDKGCNCGIWSRTLPPIY